MRRTTNRAGYACLPTAVSRTQRFEAAEHLGLLGRTSCNESRAVAEPGDGVGQDGIEPDGAGGDAQGAGAPRACGVGGVPGGVELAQDAPCGLGERDADPGRAHAGGGALEEPRAEFAFEARDAAADAGLGHVEALGAATPTPPVSTAARNRTRSLRFSNLARRRCLVAPGRSLLETTPGRGARGDGAPARGGHGSLPMARCPFVLWCARARWTWTWCARSRRNIGETTHRSGLPATYRGGRFEPAVESAARLDMCAPACEVYLHEMPGGQ